MIKRFLILFVISLLLTLSFFMWGVEKEEQAEYQASEKKESSSK